ncbi:MAG: hypothetical protein QM703_08285 [Gemmatales bacterium]
MHNHINWGEVEAHWDDFKDRIKDKWNKLTEDDMRDIRGDRHRLTQALQDRYELTRDKVEKQLDDFIENAGSWVEGARQRVVQAAQRGKHYIQENSISDMTADLRGVIRKNPIRSALVTLGIGYMLGKITSLGSRA